MGSEEHMMVRDDVNTESELEEIYRLYPKNKFRVESRGGKIIKLIDYDDDIKEWATSKGFIEK
ncbi:MAG: hypothetical protein HZC29_02155 [Thaumarchaeota archaeon]|nr:hypothetical protein [Nitrososphaerota archaeon]